MNRRHAEAAYNALAIAFRLAVEDAGGLEAAASLTRVQKSQIAAYGDVNQQDRFAPADVVLDIEAVTRRPRVTATLARLLGYELVVSDTTAAHEVPALLARIGRDASAVFADSAHALAGRALTHDERARLLRDLTDLRFAAGALHAALAEQAK